MTTLLILYIFWTGRSRASGRSQDPEEIQPLTIDKLVPGLQPLVLWMANSIELLHFIQQEVPLLLHGLSSDEQLDYREEEDEEEHIGKAIRYVLC